MILQYQVFLTIYPFYLVNEKKIDQFFLPITYPLFRCLNTMIERAVIAITHTIIPARVTGI